MRVPLRPGGGLQLNTYHLLRGTSVRGEYIKNHVAFTGPFELYVPLARSVEINLLQPPRSENQRQKSFRYDHRHGPVIWQTDAYVWSKPVHSFLCRCGRLAAWSTPWVKCKSPTGWLYN